MNTTRHRKKYIIVSMVRFIAFVAVVAVITCMIIGFTFGPEAEGSEEISYEPVMIHTGDTLWSIASAYKPNDIEQRAYIKQICVVNDITADSIYPGQTINVPIYA